MPIDAEKINAFLQEGNLDAFKQYLRNYLDTEISEENKASAYAELVDMYLDIKNDLDEKYLEVLDEMARSLESIQKGEREMEDQIKLDEVRKKLE